MMRLWLNNPRTSLIEIAVVAEVNGQKFRREARIVPVLATPETIENEFQKMEKQIEEDINAAG